MDLVGAEVLDLVLAWLGRPRHKLLELPRLALQHLFAREVALFSVRDAQQAVVGNLGDHGEVVGMQDEVGGYPVELGQLGIIDLRS